MDDETIQNYMGENKEYWYVSEVVELGPAIIETLKLHLLFADFCHRQLIRDCQLTKENA